ncbi:hypothetical protein KXR87_21320 [Yokenella regensburgei]|uniref:hypothetical protein n=1 Tax=Yokenella regensburgei TaxID=158877 RepID=UPI003F15AA29
MKYYSYSFLVPTVLSIIAVIFGVVYWQVHIVRVTFLHTALLKAIFLTALLIAALMVVLIIRRMRGTPEDLQTRLKKVVAGIIASLFMTTLVLYFLVSVIAWALPGDEAWYRTTFTYASGSRNNCSGADVFDPDLQKEVRVCYPTGDYYDHGVMVVHKRTTPLGAVMLDGRVLP